MTWTPSAKSGEKARRRLADRPKWHRQLHSPIGRGNKPPITLPYVAWLDRPDPLADLEEEKDERSE